MPVSHCDGCTAAKSKGRNAKYCDRHRKEAKKNRDKKSNEKRSHSIILKHSKIITTGTRSLEDLIDLHGEWGRTPFTQTFGYSTLILFYMELSPEHNEVYLIVVVL